MTVSSLPPKPSPISEISSESLPPTKPLRVLIVAPSLDILGGQAVQADRLLKRLTQEPTLEIGFLPVNPRLSGPLRRLQQIKFVRTVVTSVAYLVLLLTQIRRYDVIHIFSASYSSFVLAPTPALLVSRLYRKKTILNYHSGEAEDHLRRWRTAVPTLRLADSLAVPSGYLVDVFAKFGLRAEAIFNTVDTAHFRFRQRRSLRPFFLSNRNLEPLYNVACTLRAFALIQKRYPEAELTVAGYGSQREPLETLAQQLGLNRVTFVGRVANDRMPSLYEAADIYLNSSDIDNMPLSIIEAYAAGLPVVTSNAGGIPYIVRDGETGLMVERDDAEAMAACVFRLLEDNTLASALIERAQAQCAYYAWETLRDEWVSLYQRVGQRQEHECGK